MLRAYANGSSIINANANGSAYANPVIFKKLSPLCNDYDKTSLNTCFENDGIIVRELNNLPTNVPSLNVNFIPEKANNDKLTRTVNYLQNYYERLTNCFQYEMTNSNLYSSKNAKIKTSSGDIRFLVVVKPFFYLEWRYCVRVGVRT